MLQKYIIESVSENMESTMIGLHGKTVSSDHGRTCYWANEIHSDITLVFLPGNHSRCST